MMDVGWRRQNFSVANDIKSLTFICKCNNFPRPTVEIVELLIIFEGRFFEIFCFELVGDAIVVHFQML